MSKSSEFECKWDEIDSIPEFISAGFWFFHERGFLPPKWIKHICKHWEQIGEYKTAIDGLMQEVNYNIDNLNDEGIAEKIKSFYESVEAIFKTLEESLNDTTTSINSITDKCNTSFSDIDTKINNTIKLITDYDWDSGDIPEPSYNEYFNIDYSFTLKADDMGNYLGFNVYFELAPDDGGDVITERLAIGAGDTISGTVYGANDYRFLLYDDNGNKRKFTSRVLLLGNFMKGHYSEWGTVEDTENQKIEFNTYTNLPVVINSTITYTYYGEDVKTSKVALVNYGSTYGLYFGTTETVGNVDEECDGGTIIESYEGVLENRLYGETKAPWYNYEYLITEVKIGEEVRNTAPQYYSYLFSDLYNVSSIDCYNLPRPLKGITDCMFLNCTSLTEILNVGHIICNAGEDITQTAESMFADCTALKSLDLTGADTSNIETFNGMFYSCTSLKTITIDNDFDLTKVNSRGIDPSTVEVFNYCWSLQGGNGTRYDSEIDNALSYAKIDTTSQKGYFTKG